MILKNNNVTTHFLFFPFQEHNLEEKEQKGKTYCTCVKQTWTALNKRLNSRLLYLLSVEVNKVLSSQFCWYCDINGMKGKKLLNLSPPNIRDTMSKANMKSHSLVLMPSLFLTILLLLNRKLTGGYYYYYFYPSHTGTFCSSSSRFAFRLVQFCSCDSFVSTV